MSLARSSYNYRPNHNPSVFLPATRYAKDPIFNIVLTKCSPPTIVSTGEIPARPRSPAMKTGCMTRDRGVKKYPDLRRGKCDPRVINVQHPITPRHAHVEPFSLVAPSDFSLLPLPSLQSSSVYLFDVAFSFLAFGLSCCLAFKLPL